MPAKKIKLFISSTYKNILSQLIEIFNLILYLNLSLNINYFRDQNNYREREVVRHIVVVYILLQQQIDFVIFKPFFSPTIILREGPLSNVS